MHALLEGSTGWDSALGRVGPCGCPHPCTRSAARVTVRCLVCEGRSQNWGPAPVGLRFPEPRGARGRVAEPRLPHLGAGVRCRLRGKPQVVLGRLT